MLSSHFSSLIDAFEIADDVPPTSARPRGIEPPTNGLEGRSPYMDIAQLRAASCAVLRRVGACCAVLRGLVHQRCIGGVRTRQR